MFSMRAFGLVLAGLLLLGTVACGEQDTRTLEPETPDGNLEVRDGEVEDRVNLDPGPVTVPSDE